MQQLRTIVVPVHGIMRLYAATNPRLFGSVAHGDATPDSDIVLLIDRLPGSGNELLQISSIDGEMGVLFGPRVDVVAVSLMRGEVSLNALADAAPV